MLLLSFVIILQSCYNRSGPAVSYELGINLAASPAHRVRLVYQMHDRSRVSHQSLITLRKQRPALQSSGLAQHLLEPHRQPLVELSRQPLPQHVRPNASLRCHSSPTVTMDRQSRPAQSHAQIILFNGEYSILEIKPNDKMIIFEILF